MLSKPLQTRVLHGNLLAVNFLRSIYATSSFFKRENILKQINYACALASIFFIESIPSYCIEPRRFRVCLCAIRREQISERLLSDLNIIKSVPFFCIHICPFFLLPCTIYNRKSTFIDTRLCDRITEIIKKIS